MPVESKKDKGFPLEPSLKKEYSNIVIKDKLFGNIKNEMIDNRKIIGKIYFYSENIVNNGTNYYYFIDIVYYNNILNKNEYELNYLFYDKNMYFLIENNNNNNNINNTIIIKEDKLTNVLKEKYVEIKFENGNTNQLNRTWDNIKSYLNEKIVTE